MDHATCPSWCTNHHHDHYRHTGAAVVRHVRAQPTRRSVDGVNLRVAAVRYDQIDPAGLVHVAGEELVRLDMVDTGHAPFTSELKLIPVHAQAVLTAAAARELAGQLMSMANAIDPRDDERGEPGLIGPKTLDEALGLYARFPRLESDQADVGPG